MDDVTLGTVVISPATLGGLAREVIDEQFDKHLAALDATPWPDSAVEVRAAVRWLLSDPEVRAVAAAHIAARSAAGAAPPSADAIVV